MLHVKLHFRVVAVRQSKGLAAYFHLLAQYKTTVSRGLGVLISFATGLVGTAAGTTVGADFSSLFGLLAGLGAEASDTAVLAAGATAAVVGLAFITGCCAEVFTTWRMNACSKVASF